MTADTVRFSVLGQLRAWRGDRELGLGPRQQRTLLALLLLRQGEPVTAAALVAEVWGEDSPPRAVGTLRTYVSRLRKLLEPGRDAGSAPGLLVSVFDGYAVRVPRSAIDVGEFETFVAAAEGERIAGRPAEARDLLGSALALWGEEPLRGLSGPGIEAQRARLAERRLAALENRLALDVELGRHAAVLGELLALAERHPLREPLHALLMRALVLCGRPDEAQAAYARIRRALAEEFGLDPGPELSALARDIAAGGALASPYPAAAERKGREPDGFPCPAQLPGDIPDFTGRTGAVRNVCELLAAPPGSAATVVAVSGLGGIGKSALALHAAHRMRASFPHGQLYADLRRPCGHPVAPGTALGSFLRALGVADAGIPAGTAERALLFRARLADRRMLVVLDNAAGEDQVRPLLPGTPSSAFLVTSGVKPTWLYGARFVHLDVMAPDEALTLLGQVIGPERAAAEPAECARLVEACGFLPLAVRITAVRLATRPSWTVASLVERMAEGEGRLAELRVAGLSVEGVFRREYERLPAPLRRAFRLLPPADRPDAAFRAADVAASLGRPPHGAEELCESLVDISLLESPAPGWYRFHSLLAEFARTCAGPDTGVRTTAGSGPRGAVQQRSVPQGSVQQRSGPQGSIQQRSVQQHDAAVPFTAPPGTAAHILRSRRLRAAAYARATARANARDGSRYEAMPGATPSRASGPSDQASCTACAS
ncbi:BTAD domain-containing putative transcriptional regulator [Streptomyces sp. URMC 127]|uniref:AfsR/SARP family transcriptional regulator n=1 Tax=Streptomyces sp. URMC 127 TaxID=3423402 RepID=UPI003F1BA1AF